MINKLIITENVLNCHLFQYPISMSNADEIRELEIAILDIQNKIRENDSEPCVHLRGILNRFLHVLLGRLTSQLASLKQQEEQSKH